MRGKLRRTIGWVLVTDAVAGMAVRRNIPYGDPDYAPWLDWDDDGIACEKTNRR